MVRYTGHYLINYLSDADLTGLYWLQNWVRGMGKHHAAAMRLRITCIKQYYFFFFADVDLFSVRCLLSTTLDICTA